MEKLIILQADLPQEEIAIVESQVRASDYICSGFNLDVLDPYSVRNYLFQKHVHGNEVHAVLDRNLASSLTAAARRAEVKSPDELEAVRLLNFLRLAEIEIEPGISGPEYTDTYYSPNADEELELGHSLPPKGIAEIAALYSELHADKMNPVRAVHGYRQDQDYFNPYVWELEHQVKALVKQRAQQAVDGDLH